jgi:Spy/CpxP family protein refolding chaperone
MRTACLFLILLLTVASHASDTRPSTAAPATTGTQALPSPARDRFPVASPVMEKLNLTVDQQAKVADLKKTASAEYQIASTALGETNKPLWEELRGPKVPNEQRWIEIGLQIAKNNQGIRDLDQRYRVKFKELLTPDQTARYTALEAEVEANLPQFMSLVVLKKLSLSAEQETKCQALLDGYRVIIQETDESRRKLTDEVQSALQKGNQKRAVELSKQRLALSGVVQTAGTQCLEKFKAQLTDRQQATLKAPYLR